MKKKELSFLDIKNIDTITNEDILSVANKIYETYKNLGGNSSIAKSKTFIDNVYSLFNL